MPEASNAVVATEADERPLGAKSSAIARDLASQVVSGAWHAGTLLPGEHELAVRHGASRPVVREAIRLLGGAGLVETRHGVGSIVNPARLWNVFDPIVLTAHLDNRNLPAIVDELLELRRMVEVEAAGIAAQRIGATELTALEGWLQRMGACLEDPDRMAQADFAFHEAIIEATGNRFFGGVFRYARGALWQGRLLTSRSGGLAGRSAAFEYHRAIYRAIADGDADGARAVMRAHLDVAAGDLRRAVKLRAEGERESA